MAALLTCIGATTGRGQQPMGLNKSTGKGGFRTFCVSTVLGLLKVHKLDLPATDYFFQPELAGRSIAGGHYDCPSISAYYHSA